MTQMKDSGVKWIGEIPSDWSLCRLKDIGSLYGGLTGKKGDDFSVDEGDNFAYFIPFTNIFNNTTIDSSNLGKVKVTTDEEQNSVEKGDVLFLMSSEDKDGIGKTSLMRDKVKPLYLNSFCKGLHINKDVNSAYINYLMLSDVGHIHCSLYSNGFTRVNLRQDNLLVCSIPCPPLATQQRIASYLDEKCGEIDSLVQLQEEMIAELKAYKQSVITEAVTKGLNPNAKMKDSGVEWIGEIPEEWEVCRFKHVATIKANLVHPNDYKDYPQVSPDCIEKGSGKLIGYTTVEKANVISDNHLFYKGQLVYSKIRPTLNKVIIAPFDGLCSADMYPIETVLNSNYLKYQMLSDSFNGQVALVVQDRVKMPKINQVELGDILMVVPSTEMQSSIVEYLDRKTTEIDALISIKEEKISELKDYKKSLIYEVVTGKKEVV